MTTGGYVRVSSARQRDESDSPANQRERLAAAGATEFYEDLAVSGWKLEKRRGAAGFRRLRADIEAGRLTRLLATRLDRIARRDAIVLELADLCERCGVEFVTLGSGRVETGSASGWLSVKVQLLMAEHYSRQLSENVRSALAAQRARGIPVRAASNLPFHLTREPGTRHGVIPSEHWPAARRMIDEFLLGDLSCRAAARRLAELGGPRMLGESIGEWFRAPAGRGHLATREGEILLRDVWPAILTPAEHLRIVEILEERRSGGAIRRSGRTRRALSGLCRCSCPGGSAAMACVQSVRNGRRSDYLRCRHTGGGGRYVSAPLIEAQLLERLPEVIDGLAARRAAAGAEIGAEAADWTRELRAREAIPAEYRREADRARIEELRGLIAAAREAPLVTPSRLLEIEIEILDAGRWFGRPAIERNEILRDAFRSVTVDPDRRAVIEVVPHH